MADDKHPVKLLCVRCGHANDERDSRCESCRSPLDAFASGTPWEMGTATGSAYATPTSPRSKPIIFWGAWLYFGPSAIGAFYFIAGFILSWITGESRMENLTESHAVLVLALMYGLLSSWALWSVTKGYLKKNSDPTD
ncbi:hypothetical protein [Oceaniferula marina]|nr:hypothetical protein [Oceaniferula marina]